MIKQNVSISTDNNLPSYVSYIKSTPAVLFLLLKDNNRHRQ
jgi:hypothetical protein